MKKSYKLFLSLLILGISASAVFAATFTKFSAKFIQKFRDCDFYEETVNSTFENKNFTFSRKIIGWRNGSCKYEETITSPNEKYKLECTFPALQVDELYKAMKSKTNVKEPERYEMDLFAETTDAKTGAKKYVVSGSTTLIGNKAYIAWTKYQNNPYFCKPAKLK